MNQFLPWWGWFFCLLDLSKLHLLLNSNRLFNSLSQANQVLLSRLHHNSGSVFINYSFSIPKRMQLCATTTVFPEATKTLNNLTISSSETESKLVGSSNKYILAFEISALRSLSSAFDQLRDFRLYQLSFHQEILACLIIQHVNLS